MVVYIDLLILENFIINCFLLKIIASTVRVKVKWRLLLVAGFIGSLYVIVLLYPPVAFLNILPIKLLIAFLMIVITFKKRDKNFILKTSIVFIVYSMVLSGVCSFFQYSSVTGFTYKKLIVSIILVYIIIERLVVYIKERKSLTELIYKIDIVLNKNLITLNGFLDTGNELREPVTNMPVILVNGEILKNLNTETCLELSIPYKVFNGETGILTAFKPDYIIVHMGNQIIKREVFIAVNNEVFTNTMDYQALLSIGIF